MPHTISLNSQNKYEIKVYGQVDDFGLLSFLFLDYSARYADPTVAVAMRGVLSALGFLPAPA